MKRVQLFLFCLLFTFLMTACQKKEEIQESSQEEVIKEVEDTSRDEVIRPTEDQEAIQDDTVVQPPIEDEILTIEVNHSLTGIELIKAAKIVHPREAISYEINNVLGSGDMAYHIKRLITRVGNNYKEVTTSEGATAGDEGKMIMIYHSEDKMNYQYYEATMSGYKYQEDLAGTGPALEEEYDLTTLYAEESNLVKAEVIQYEEEPVMYFEITEAGNKVSSWVSLRYGITVKTEVYEGDQMISSSVVSNIQIPEGLDDTYFMPPSEVLFEDYSVDEASPISEEAQ